MALRGCERERAEPFDRRRARQKRGDAHIARRHGAEDGNGKEDGQEARVFRVYHAPQAAFRQRTVPEGGLTLGPLGIGVAERARLALDLRSEEHTSELQSLMRISYAVFCLK